MASPGADLRRIVFGSRADALPHFLRAHLGREGDPSSPQTGLSPLGRSGVRLGEQVAKDMVAVRIGPDTRMAVVGAPSYLASRSHPKTPEDLTAHDCIGLRMQSGGLLTWEFEKGGREVRMKVEERLVFNTSLMALEAAVAGHGLAYLLEERVQACLADGRLVRVLGDWCSLFSGYHLHYPSRRQPRPAFARLVDELGYRGAT